MSRGKVVFPTLEMLKDDARERPLTYTVLFFQLLLVIVFVYEIWSLKGVLESSGCRFLVEIISDPSEWVDMTG